MTESSPAESIQQFFCNIERDEEQAHNNIYNALENEQKMYMEGRVAPSDMCIFQWWKENATRFPRLARVATNILGVPATQAYSERLFSRAGNIISEKRSYKICSMLSDNRQIRGRGVLVSKSLTLPRRGVL